MQASLFEEQEVFSLFRDRLFAVSKEKLEATVKSSKTYVSVAKKLNLVFSTGINPQHRRWLTSRLDYEGIDHSHLEAAFNLETRGKSPKRTSLYANMTNEEILKKYFIVDSPHHWPTLKKIISTRNLLPTNCSECGLGPEWNGAPLVLQYDHINGINTDQRIENLRTICPNCHTQTDTFGGRNAQKIDWGSFAEAMEAKKKFDIPPPDGG